MSIPLIIYLKPAKAFRIATGKTTSVGSSEGGAATKSLIIPATPVATEDGSITANATAAIPLVPGGGGFKAAPGNIINCDAVVAWPQAVAVCIAGDTGSIAGTKANCLKVVSNNGCIQVNSGGGSIFTTEGSVCNFNVTPKETKVAMSVGPKAPVGSGGILA